MPGYTRTDWKEGGTKCHGIAMNVQTLAQHWGLTGTSDTTAGTDGAAEYGPAPPPKYVEELRIFAQYLKTQPNTAVALGAPVPAAGGGAGGAGGAGGFEMTGDLSNKSAAFKAVVRERLDAWKVQLRATNVYMDTIPAEQTETEKEKIIDALEREWAARGWPWSGERASQAHPMSPSGSGSNAGSSGGGSTSGLPPRTPIPEVDEDALESVPRTNPNAPPGARDSMRSLQPPAASQVADAEEAAEAAANAHPDDEDENRAGEGVIVPIRCTEGEESEESEEGEESEESEDDENELADMEANEEEMAEEEALADAEEAAEAAANAHPDDEDENPGEEEEPSDDSDDASDADEDGNLAGFIDNSKGKRKRGRSEEDDLDRCERKLNKRRTGSLSASDSADDDESESSDEESDEESDE